MMMNQKAEQPMGPDYTIYCTKPLYRGISQQEIAGLFAVLDLVCVLCRHSEAARVAVAEKPGWSAVPTIIGGGVGGSPNPHIYSFFSFKSPNLQENLAQIPIYRF